MMTQSYNVLKVANTFLAPTSRFLVPDLVSFINFPFLLYNYINTNSSTFRSPPSIYILLLAILSRKDYDTIPIFTRPAYESLAYIYYIRYYKKNFPDKAATLEVFDCEFAGTGSSRY